ncbi:restriction endonuclease [Bernardetia sp. MNP-M8]|uniref:nSTAND3 domain-containing NTPase n=1 Tax=Bernardetia sp. MNP-M8 TaxID=3127470 RepID=UPI0030D50F02
MNNYDFSTLNDKEFETLVKDLLNAKFGFELQDFKKGRDKGIDLRYSTSENDNSLVVQVKHYVNSKYANLKYGMINTELPKVKKLKPSRYIVVTSLELSPQEKDELKKELKPFILSSQDIIARNELNSYLSENKEIEKKYFKLWFSSINVFNSILNNAVEGRTRFLLEKIKRKLPFYVPTKKTDDANRILEKEKLLLITGQPGIGKTTLAEILLLDKAEKGYKIYQIENVRDAEDVFSPNPEQKQLFYFDDFLGANYLEIVNADKTETQLTNFIDRVRHSENKYLILTTRTVILNYANEKYEKISRASLKRDKFEIELTDYNDYQKALILYNHLYFNQISNDLYEIIIQERFYWNIIKHKNYTPRLIEFLVEKREIENLTPVEYKEIIINNLEYPKKIWKKSFENQISDLDRCLLFTLFSFEVEPKVEVLREAYKSRLNFEMKEYNLSISSNTFEKSIKILQNGFILSKIYSRDSNSQHFGFINPSLTDFLISYIEESYSTKKNIISSVLYIEQLAKFNPNKKIFILDEEFQRIIFNKIRNNELQSINKDKEYLTDDSNVIQCIRILINYCDSIDTDEVLLEYVQKIDLNSHFLFVYKDIMIMLEYANKKCFSFFKENFILIIEKVLKLIDDQSDAEVLVDLFYKYNDYDDYILDESKQEKISNMIEVIFESEKERTKNKLEESILDISEIEEANTKLQEFLDELHEFLLPDVELNFSVDEFYTEDWMDIVEENNNYNDDYEDDVLFNIGNDINPSYDIDDLFD